MQYAKLKKYAALLSAEQRTRIHFINSDFSVFKIANTQILLYLQMFGLFNWNFCRKQLTIVYEIKLN